MTQELKNLKQGLKKLFWLTYGLTLKNPVLPENPVSFLFVCKGNICRSPFAERLAEKMVNNKSYGSMTFVSAGIQAPESSGPPENAVLSAERFGVRLGDHKARQLDAAFINSADMVLVMEPWHLKTLIKNFPDAREKIFLLSLFDKDDAKEKDVFIRYNIADPYGRPPEQFDLCYRRIEKCLMGLFSSVKN